MSNTKELDGLVALGDHKPRSSTAKRVLIALLVLALIGAGVGLGVVLTRSTAANASEVFLQPANAQGQNPFTPNVGRTATTSATTASALTPSTGTNLASFSGNSVGLYGGTMDLSSCNPQQMISYLEANPAKAQAWAGAEGIPVSQVSTYIGGLTPMTLRYDTRVTNHGYVNGEANAIPEILQAGQAVLVDAHGVPRARCYCGNPLTPPAAVAGTPTYVGPQWTTFSPHTTIVVQQSTTTINNFTLIDNATGQAFSRPTGSIGTSDAPGPACGGPSMPGVTVCTNPAVPPPTPAPASTTTTTVPPPTTTTTAPPAPSTGNSLIPDGTYLISQSPACGNTPIDGWSMTVADDTATMNEQQVPLSPAPVTAGPQGFIIQFADGNVMTLALNGSVVAQGALYGNGETGGVNPSGATGWVCQFTWNGTLQSGGTAPSSDSSGGSVQYSAHPPGDGNNF